MNNDIRQQIWRHRNHLIQLCPEFAFRHNTDHILRHLDNLFHLRHGTCYIKAFLLRIFLIRIFLCHQENHLVFDHGCFQCCDGFLAAYIKMQDHIRQAYKPSKCHCRHSAVNITHLFLFTFLSLVV